MHRFADKQRLSVIALALVVLLASLANTLHTGLMSAVQSAVSTETNATTLNDKSLKSTSPFLYSICGALTSNLDGPEQKGSGGTDKNSSPFGTSCAVCHAFGSLTCALVFALLSLMIGILTILLVGLKGSLTPSRLFPSGYIPRAPPRLRSSAF